MKHGCYPRLSDALAQDSDTTPVKAKRSWPKKHVKLPARITVLKLTEITELKAFQIIARLMDLGVFASMDYEMDFATATKIVRPYSISTEPEAL